jgi:hypothetical protein
MPLSLGVSAANTHDSLGLQPQVRDIPPIRSRRGPRRRRPASCMRTRVTTMTTCGDGYVSAGSVIASPANGANPRNGLGAIAGSSKGPCPGWPAAEGSTAVTNARPNTSLPSSA